MAPLSGAFDVRYATPRPGPTEGADHEWLPLEGDAPVALARAAKRAMLARDVDVISVHDAELLPVALWVRGRRRVQVVFDVHEDYPARALMRDGLPGPLRRWAAQGVGSLLRAAERMVWFSLAEPSFRRVFRRPWPVFPNHLVPGWLPDPAPDGGYVVAVGDVTEVRGAFVAVRGLALSGCGLPLVLVGRCDPGLAERLRGLARQLGVELRLHGQRSHAAALEVCAGAAVAVCPLMDAPGLRHPLPSGVLEQLALGVPTVASDLPGAAAATGGLPGMHLVQPEDPLALAKGIRAALRAGERDRVRANAQRVRRVFAFDPAPVRAYYAEVLSGRALGG